MHTILLAEDEQLVRDLAVSCLERANFRVIPAANAAEALAACRCSYELDLLLTDVQMGEGMDGLELAGTVLAERPEIKVLVMSGTPDVEPLVEQRHLSFLRKPFTTAALVVRVQEVLGMERKKPGWTGMPASSHAS